MKGVYIYSNFDFSKKSAGATRMFYYAQALANETTKVYLTSCTSSTIGKEDFNEIFKNVFILKNSTNTLVQSFFKTYLFLKRLYNFSKKNSKESTFIFYPSPLLYLEILALYYLKFSKKCSVFYELNEVRKYSSKFHNKASLKKLKYSVKKMVFKSVFSSLEYCLKFYDGLICISSTIEKYGKKYNNNTIRVPILTNPDAKKEFSDRVYSVKNSFNIGFSGKIHPDKENLLSFFNVLGKLKEKKVKFTLNLCGPLEKEHENILLQKKSREVNISNNINYFGNLNTLELDTFLNQQQLLVIPRGYTLQNHFGFSTKLSDYLNHAKPVLITDVSDNKIYIKDNENGFLVSADNETVMLDKLCYIIKNYPSVHKNIETKALETSKKVFYYRAYSDKLHEFLFKIKFNE